MNDRVLHILWMNGGLSCDGESVALTAATQPSIEEIVAGALPGLPPVVLHWPFFDYDNGDEFIGWFHRAAAGELDPFLLIVEGSIPDESTSGDGYWSGFGTENGRPITSTEWLDRLAPRATAIMAVGTCAAYGGVHAMAGNPTGARGVPDYLGWRHLHRLHDARLPGQIHAVSRGGAARDRLHAARPDAPRLHAEGEQSPMRAVRIGHNCPAAQLSGLLHIWADSGGPGVAGTGRARWTAAVPPRHRK